MNAENIELWPAVKRRAIEDALARFPGKSQDEIATMCKASLSYVLQVNKLIIATRQGREASRPGEITAWRLHKLWRASTTRVDNYLALLKEQKAVDEASNFARWLNNSGLLEILRDNPQPEPLQVDGAALTRSVNLLIEGNGAVYSKWGKTPPPEYAKTDIEGIHDQLAVIIKKLAA